MNISFLIILKNRIKLPFKYNTIEGYINLLGNNLNSLKSLIKPNDNWEFIVVDFNSTDANVDDFLKETLNMQNITYKLIELKENFNKGKGFNIGISHCLNEIVFCLDADMIIKTYDLFDDIEKYVKNQEKALFPICWSYKDHTHTAGWKRNSGLGNVICLKKDFKPYIEKTTWGFEDDSNYYKFIQLNKAIRTYYDDNFIHQWHPPTEWKS